MDYYLFPIKAAIIFFPFVALVLTLPFAIYQYRVYGYINKFRVLIIFSFIFYLLAAYYLVILPLPKTRDVKSIQRDDVEYVSLKPFKFIEDIKESSGFDINDQTTYIGLLKDKEFLQVAFNVLLTLPLGIYLHYYFSRTFGQTIAISFFLSLFFELTQLSGLYGIYNGPYRVFDVDDLILNTLGGGLGYLISPILTFFLPRADNLDKGVRLDTLRVGYPRRLLAYFLDMLLINLIPGFNHDVRIRYLSIIIYFILLPYVTNGRTIGLWITKTKVKGRGDRLKFKEIFLRNTILFFGIIEVNSIFSKLVVFNQDTDLYYMSIFFAVFHISYLIFLFIHYISRIFKKDIFFYEELSKTRIGIDDKNIVINDNIEEETALKFIKANENDVNRIMEIIKEGQEYFKSQGIPQWQNGYPNDEVILSDINRGNFYVLEEDDLIIGATALIYGNEPTYDKIFDGQWLTDYKEYATIHRLAVDNSKKGQGYGGKLIDAVAKDALEKNINSIRVDTHRLNNPMRTLLKKNGFEYCGVIYLEDGAERLAFEKILRNI